MLTASLNQRAENFSVGSFCCDLASANLSIAYTRHLPAVPGRLPSTFHPEDVFQENEKGWTAAGKPLYEIQVAVCERALEQWASVQGAGHAEKGQFHAYTVDEKARFSAAVRKEIEELKRTKRAIFIDAMLPGVAAPSGWEGFDAERAKSER